LENTKKVFRTNRLIIAAIACLGVAAASAAHIGLASPVPAAAFGLAVGIIAWTVHFHLQPASVKNSPYPFVPGRSTLYTYAGVSAISCMALCLPDLIWLKLAGAVGVAACIGTLVAAQLSD
jgi:hypothetical protein